MANLKSSAIYGDLTINSSGKITLPAHKGTWFQGIVDSPILQNNTSGGTDYCPTIFQSLSQYNSTYATIGHNDIGFIFTADTTMASDSRLDPPSSLNGYSRFYFNVRDGNLGRDFNEVVNTSYSDSSGIIIIQYDVKRKSRSFIHSGNYTNYVPSKAGSGASGTWKINISGNAAGLSSTLATNKGGTGRSQQNSGCLFCTSSSSTLLGAISNLTGNDNTMVLTNSSKSWAHIYVYNKNNEAGILSGDAAGVYFYSELFTDTVPWQSRGSKWLIRIDTAGTVTVTTSDRRKKFYIEDMPEDEANAVLNVPIRNFIFKEDIKHNNLEQNGVFAQDLRNIMLKNNIGNRPYLQWEYNDDERDDVYYDIDRPESDDMTYSVSYTNFVPALIKGWQIQNQKIEELEKKLAILRIKKENKQNGRN